MNRALRHLVSLWGPFWPLPAGFFVVYCAIMAHIGDLRPEHVVFLVVVSFFAYVGPRTKQFLIDVSPYIFVAVGYDLVRYARRIFVTRDRVLGCELRDVEVALFPAGGGMSAQEWLVSRATPALDLLFAAPYAVFAYVALLYAGYLYFVDRARMRHYLWAFALANYLSFTLWLVVPAAPPWYVHAHGCVIDLSVAPSPAGLARVDASLGVGYFAMFYSRAASVFGALPSMHNAYPLLGLLTAWPKIGWRTKPFHILYLLIMFLASLYLDHHWIVDAIAGWAVAVAAVLAVRYMLQRVGASRPSSLLAEPQQAE